MAGCWHSQLWGPGPRKPGENLCNSPRPCRLWPLSPPNPAMGVAPECSFLQEHFFATVPGRSMILRPKLGRRVRELAGSAPKGLGSNPAPQLPGCGFRQSRKPSLVGLEQAQEGPYSEGNLGQRPEVRGACFAPRVTVLSSKPGVTEPAEVCKPSSVPEAMPGVRWGQKALWRWGRVLIPWCQRAERWLPWNPKCSLHKKHGSSVWPQRAELGSRVCTGGRSMLGRQRAPCVGCEHQRLA